MKSFVLLLNAALLLTTVGCSKKNSTVPDIQPAADTAFRPANATLLKQGNFSGAGGHTVNGTVTLYEYKGNKYLYLDNFLSTPGPDLRVYISTTTQATQFVSLGTLKGTNGMQTYLISNPPDFTQFNKILIWCQQFSVLFGAAILQ